MKVLYKHMSQRLRENMLPSGNVFHQEGLVFSWRVPQEAPLLLWQLPLQLGRLFIFPLPQSGPLFGDPGSE
jgi:hypothetical protein